MTPPLTSAVALLPGQNVNSGANTTTGLGLTVTVAVAVDSHPDASSAVIKNVVVLSGMKVSDEFVLLNVVLPAAVQLYMR